MLRFCGSNVTVSGHWPRRSGQIAAEWSPAILSCIAYTGWLGSRVVSVLDSGSEGLGSNRSRDTVG